MYDDKAYGEEQDVLKDSVAGVDTEQGKKG